MTVFRTLLGLLALVLAACGEKPTQGGGVSSAGASPASLAWGTALKDWPSKGDPGKIAKEPVDQSSYNLWHDIRVSPKDDVPEPVLEIMVKSKQLINPLHDLNDQWDVPATDGVRISTRTIRGLGKSVWSDLRLAVREDDRARAVNDLVLLGNMPKVARAIDPSDRGLMPTLAVASILYWGLYDLYSGGEEMAPTPEECQRIMAAASWVNDPDPFGPISEQNLPIWKGFQERELPQIRNALQKICGN